MTTGNAPSERSILFSGDMVRAILNGSKTQTRRAVKPSACELRSRGSKGGPWPVATKRGVRGFVSCPYGVEGGLLWIKETWQTHCDLDRLRPLELPRDTAIQYPASYDGWVSKRRPSLFMPRWASRITLSITNIRAEYLQDISEEDAKAEGCGKAALYDYSPRGFAKENYRAGYFKLWDEINGAGSWSKNPIVWVIEFPKFKGKTH